MEIFSNYFSYLNLNDVTEYAQILNTSKLNEEKYTVVLYTHGYG